MDYSALAKKYGGQAATSTGGSDLSALAAKFGGSAAAAPEAPVEAPQKSFGQKAVDFGAGVANIINNNPVSKALTSLAALPVQLGAKALGQKDPFAEGVGTGAGALKPAEVTTYEGKTPGQYGSEEAGNAAQVASLFFPYGKVAGLAKEGLVPVLGKTIGSRAAQVASGAAGGYGVDVASNLQSGKPLDQSLSPGAGTVVGGGLPLVGPLVGAAARGAGETLGVSTGAGYGAIKEAFNAASAGGERAKAYTDALRGKTLPEDIVDEAKSSLGQIISDRSKSYSDQLAQITKGSTKSFDISPVQKKLDSMLGDFNVEKNPDTGALDFSRSPGLGRYKTDLNDIQDVLDNWGSKPGDRTVVGIDKLKQTLDDFRRGTADSRKFDSFVTALRNSAKDIIKDEPGYSKLVGDYSEKTGLIKDIQKGLSLGDKTSIDTGFRKLTTALRTNNEFRKELIDELDKASGGFLSSKVAGQQLSEALPRGLARQIEGFGAAGAVLSGVGIIPLLKVAAFASPRVVGEIVNALGLSKSLFTQLLDHLGASKAQFPGDRAIDEATPAVKDYLAKNPPSLGLATKDVNKMTPAELEGLPPEARPKVLGGAPNDAEAFKGFEDITTKVLDDLKGRTTVSRQYVLDALNRADIKQTEKDIIKPILDQEGPTIKVKDFANKIKTELLPIEVGSVALAHDTARYEAVNLPDDLRGPVADYREKLYTSPIKTSAASVHFSDHPIDNYFAHTRVEDLPDGNQKSLDKILAERGQPKSADEVGLYAGAGGTRRVVELQSDLFQKGRLENEIGDRNMIGATYRSKEAKDEYEAAFDARKKEVDKLEPYRNTWQDRIIREEVKQAALDGKTKIQFPTGETAMKIEGLGGNEGTNRWWDITSDPEGRNAIQLKPEDLSVGKEVYDGNDKWIVTDVLGDGKFKAVYKDAGDFHAEDGVMQGFDDSGNEIDVPIPEDMKETFDISGKVDKENPIYKFYEKELGKFLKNKYNAEVVTDPQGVSWYEVNVPEAAAKQGVQAFGKAKIGALAGGAAASAAGVGALAAQPKSLSK